jgi:hypothetical protein
MIAFLVKSLGEIWAFLNAHVVESQNSSVRRTSQKIDQWSLCDRHRHDGEN